jgi:hypothetical protein
MALRVGSARARNTKFGLAFISEQSITKQLWIVKNKNRRPARYTNKEIERQQPASEGWALLLKGTKCQGTTSVVQTEPNQIVGAMQLAEKLLLKGTKCQGTTSVVLTEPTKFSGL